MRRLAATIATLATGATFLGASAAQPVVPSAGLAVHEVATGLRGGYQVVPADLNKDGKIDLVVVASGLQEFIWFENPGWQKHVIATDIRAPINAAAADLDGDGIPELALAHGFATTPDRSTGIVTLYTHGPDVTAPWTGREIDRVPTAHRLRWYTPAGSRERVLVNAPLCGPTATAPDYKGKTPLYAYRAPDWKREALPEAEEGVVHAIEPVQWVGAGPSLLSAGFLGIHRYEIKNGTWTVAPVVGGDSAPWPKSGSSDVSVLRNKGARMMAAIEPWHGHQVVVYRESKGTYERSVIDNTIADGHTLVAADLDGDGRDEIVVGERQGAKSARLYRMSASGEWTSSMLDAGGMAAAGCAVADLNGDKKLDVVCVGTSTANLKWYEGK